MANHKLPVDALPSLIQEITKTVSGLTANPVEPESAPPISMTAAQIRKSITPAGPVSFEDGMTYQTLKRHLTGRDLTVAEYRAKWGLPTNYPATASAYAAKRSEWAKVNGLVRKVVAKVAEPVKKARGRPKDNA